MKRVPIAKFKQNYTKYTNKMPQEGFYITVNKVPKFHLTKIKEKVKTEVQAEAVLQEIDGLAVGTFERIDVNAEHRLGICSRCGRHGELIKRGYMNEYGRIMDGAWICKGKCYNGKERGKLDPVVRSENPTELRAISKKVDPDKNSDFGAMHERNTF